MTKVKRAYDVINNSTKKLNYLGLKEVKIYFDRVSISNRDNGSVIVEFPFEGSLELFLYAFGDEAHNWPVKIYKYNDQEFPVYQPSPKENKIQVEVFFTDYGSIKSSSDKAIIEEAKKMMQTTVNLIERNNRWVRNNYLIDVDRSTLGLSR